MKKLAVISLTMLVLLSCLPVGVALSGQEKVPVIIMFRGRQDLDLVKSLGGRVKSVYKFQPAVAAEMPEAAVDALGRNPSIQYVVRDLEMELVQTTPWGVERIGAPTVHVSGNKGAGVNVAILDSGIDTDHADLSYEYGYDFSGSNEQILRITMATGHMSLGQWRHWIMTSESSGWPRMQNCTSSRSSPTMERGTTVTL